MPNPLKLTKAQILALVGNIVTAAVAVVPAWAPEKQAIVAAIGGVISNVYLLHDGALSVVRVVERLIATRPTPEALRADATQVLKDEATKVDLNGLAQQAIAGNLGVVVRDELQKILSAQPAPVAAPAPVDPAAVPPVA